MFGPFACLGIDLAARFVSALAIAMSSPASPKVPVLHEPATIAEPYNDAAAPPAIAIGPRKD